MRSKHEILNKFDYMKAYSFNLILTERTNSELEHERNVGKIDSAFYRNFSWQIMGKKKERQLSNIEAKDIVKAKKQEVHSEAAPIFNGRLQEVSSHKDGEREVVQSRTDLSGGAPKSSHKDGEREVVQSRTDLSGGAPKRYTTTCYFKPRTVPSWYTESLLIYIGSTKRRYDEKVWFKHTLHPYYWSESMVTEVNMPNITPHVSEVVIPTEKSNVHYMSLETQQLAASAS